MTDSALDERPARRRATRSSPAQRRSQIIAAAIDVFGRAGYRQGSLKDVATEVGLTIQGLLHYFHTKEDLLMAVLEYRNEARNTEMQRVAATEGVLSMYRDVLRENLEHPGFMRLFVTLSAEATDPGHPAHAHFAERYRALDAALVASAEADRAAGRLRPDADAQDVAEQVVALCDGLQLQYLHRPDFDLLTAFDHAVAHLRP